MFKGSKKYHFTFVYIRVYLPFKRMSCYSALETAVACE